MRLPTWFLVLVAACGDQVTVESPPGSTTATTTGAGAAATTSTSTGVGGGGGDACSVYDDEAGSFAVTLRFVSQSDRDIYVPATCGQLEYEAIQVGVDDGVDWAYVDDCLQTCEDRRTQGLILCEPCAPTAFLLPAGGVLEVAWPGDGLRFHDDVPAACFFDDVATGSCSQKVAAPAGTYRFYAAGYADCVDCVCDPVTGRCEGKPSGDQAFSNADMVPIPGDGTVDVVFGGCAFPCP